jgi:hypothetical protein
LEGRFGDIAMPLFLGADTLAANLFHAGVIQIKEGDSPMEEADRLPSTGTADFHLLLWFLEEPVDGPGADFLSFVATPP